jgi:hypothetical protein
MKLRVLSDQSSRLVCVQLRAILVIPKGFDDWGLKYICTRRPKYGTRTILNHFCDRTAKAAIVHLPLFQEIFTTSFPRVCPDFSLLKATLTSSS